MIQKILVYGVVGDNKCSEKVVHSLMERKKGLGRFLYMDNFYYRIDLLEKWLEEKTYATGTLRANRAQNP